MEKSKIIELLDRVLKITNQPDIKSSLEDYKKRVESGEELNANDLERIADLISLEADVANADLKYMKSSLDSEEDFVNEMLDLLNQANEDLTSASSTLSSNTN